MQVRTGKTLTALETARKYGAKNVLFLTKKKAQQSIINDYESLSPDYELTVLNYDMAHKLSPAYDLIILDEAHCLGQYPIPAKKIKIIKALCFNIPIIYLSGTPTPESDSQIFHQLFLSSYSPFIGHKNFYSWAAMFVTIKKKYYFNRAINDYSCGKKDLIHSYINHLFISYTQEEAGFESYVKEIILFVPMKERTYQIANTLIKDNVFIGQSDQKIIADTAVKLRSKLHQIYSGSVIDEAGTAIPFDDSKAAYIKKRFENKKIAIFYKYKAELELIKKHFNNLTYSPEVFNEKSDLVFCSQVQSGREGTNLSSADCIIMFNIDYSAISYWQARARSQTKDRIKDAEVYWIFSMGGIEEKIYKQVMNKKDYTLYYFQKDFERIPVTE